eukprot:5602687-Prymnesium_polylepis.1
MALVFRESSAFASCDLKQLRWCSTTAPSVCSSTVARVETRERAMARARPADGLLCSSARGAPCASLLARMDLAQRVAPRTHAERLRADRCDVLAPWEHSDTCPRSSHVSIRVNWVTLLRAKPCTT